MEVELYVNGLFWTKRSVWDSDCIDYVPFDVLDSKPMTFEEHDGSEPLTRMVDIKTVRFVPFYFHDGKQQRRVFNLDDRDIYVDIITNDLRSRTVENYDEVITEIRERQKYIERPVGSRFDILDL